MDIEFFQSFTDIDIIYYKNIDIPSHTHANKSIG